MIVVCTTCQARFKVADEKIGPRGAKVRCSKCQTVFVVHRELGVVPVEPAPSSPIPPAAVRPAPAPAPAPSGMRGMELDLESEPMGGTRPSGLIADPFARSAPAAGAADPFSAHPAPPQGADPFAASPAPAARDPFAADPFSAPSAPEVPANGGAAFGAVDPFVATVSNAPAGAPSSAVTDLSDLIGSPAPSGTPIPAAPPAVELPSEPSGILESGFDFDPGAGPGPELVAPTPVPFQPPPTAAPEPDLALAEATPAAAAAPPMPGSADFGGIDPFAGASSQDFGGPDEDFAAEPDLVEPAPSPAPAAPPPPAPLELAAAPPSSAPPPPEGQPEEDQPEGPEAAAAAGLRQRSSRFRAIAINAVSLAALIVVAVGFLALGRGVRPGGVGGLRGLFRPDAVVSESFAVERLRSGLYDRADAPPLLFVTGSAVSRVASAVPGLRVRVEILRKGAVVARGEARAGAVPTPEQIYASKDAAGVAALLEQVGATAPTSVKPGDAVPFLVAISDYPQDVSGLGLRVDVEPLAPAPTPDAPRP